MTMTVQGKPERAVDRPGRANTARSQARANLTMLVTAQRWMRGCHTGSATLAQAPNGTVSTDVVGPGVRLRVHRRGNPRVEQGAAAVLVMCRSDIERVLERQCSQRTTRWTPA